ncbi:hypothetical protein HDU97_008566 [Phlyctochytrium planicorne]|nr:hypothetical protein HDU97_008566 [Phlyctochytrium planicorne]
MARWAPTSARMIGHSTGTRSNQIVPSLATAKRIPIISTRTSILEQGLVGSLSNNINNNYIRLLSLSRLFHSTPFPRSTTTEPPAGGPNTSSSSSSSSEAPSGKRSLKTLFREYGPIAVGVYFTLSFTVFLICFTSITVLGVDAQTIGAIFTRIKGFLGFKKPEKHEQTSEEAREEEEKTLVRFLPEFMQNPWLITVVTNVLLAMAMTKLFIPIKVGVVVAVTPAVAKRLRAMGFDFGKMNYKDMAQDARGRIKDRVANRGGEQ